MVGLIITNVHKKCSIGLQIVVQQVMVLQAFDDQDLTQQSIACSASFCCLVMARTAIDRCDGHVGCQDLMSMK